MILKTVFHHFNIDNLCFFIYTLFIQTRKVTVMEQALYPANHDGIPRPRVRVRPREKGRNPYDGLRPWSAITHGCGAVLAIAATVLLLVKTALTGGDPWKIVSFAIYGASMVELYTASTLYHSIRTSVKGRVGLRKYDHASIYILIAGTYTPVCLTALRGPFGWALFGIIWALAIAGLVMSLAWIDCPRWVTAGVCLAMGWLAVIAVYPLWLAVGWPGVSRLLAGGLLYTAGGVSYGLKWPGRDNPQFGCHEIFHLFIVLGSVAHFLLMYQVMLPLP